MLGGKVPLAPEQGQNMIECIMSTRRKRVADEEEERRKRLLVRTVGTCFPAVCGGEIVLTPREVPVGEWRSGPMPTKMEYTCACIKCGAAYNPEHFLNKENQASA